MMPPARRPPATAPLRLGLLWACVACLWLANPGRGMAARPAIDFFQGPLVNATRVVGLGGAYVAVAEGAAGHLSNPASYAVREQSYADDWFDWDLGFTLVTMLGDSVDFDMSGAQPTLTEARAEQLALNLKFGRFGVGMAIQSQSFSAVTTGDKSNGSSFEYDLQFGGLGMAYALSDGELVIGVTLSGSQAHLRHVETRDKHSKTVDSVYMADSSLIDSVGVLFAPAGQRYRLGCSLRTSSELTQAGANRDAGGELVDKEQIAGRDTPRAVLQGSAFALGFSYVFGPRPTNITPTYGENPKVTRSSARRYVLVSADLEILGGVDHDAVGVLGYMADEMVPSGRSTVVSVRAGVESEFLPNRLRLRGGSYFEPSRFEGSAGRLHGVAGGDVRLSLIWDWSISAVIDVAENYYNSSLSIGFWH